MKLLNTDKQQGYVKIKVESKDDLWFLKDFILPRDKVRKFTQRTKLDGREKKSLKLTIDVEKIGYQEGERLRLTGEITKGSDDIELGYHTLNVKKDEEIELWRENFTEREWEELYEREKKESYKVLIVLIEKENADFYMVEESGITNLAKIDSQISGKMYEGSKNSKEEFYKEIASVVERYSKREVQNIVLAGPGFHKEKVKEIVDNKELKSKIFSQDTSVTGRTGLNEAIKRGALKQVVESSRIDEESEVIEEFFEKLRKDGKATYGKEQVENLINQGAVEKLIITQEKYREETDLAKKVEQMGGETQIIHTDHEQGQRLENFSGIAAFLRYKP